jgi:hypothetical protein
MAPSLPSLCIMRFLAVSAVALMFVPSGAQTPMANVPDVRLEVQDGKTAYYLGEPIQLDLVFENRTGSPFLLNNTLYGDNSEDVEITPQTGWFQWQTQSNHDYASMANLDATQMRIPLQLDQGFVFREPGQYHIRVKTARLTAGNELGGTVLPLITTNEVTIDVKQMPDDVEAAKLNQIRADSAGTGGDHMQAMQTLAALGGEDALTEKIKRFEEGDDCFRRVYRQAFATTRDLQRQLTLLEQAWTDPKLTPGFDTTDALDETRRLLAGRNLPGWRMGAVSQPPDPTDQRIADLHRTDMAALLDSMPARQGESLTMGAYILVMFGGLNDSQRLRAVDYAVEQFPHMDDVAQHMLLETPRPPLRDPRLIPVLESMLAANSSDSDATAALLAIAPSEAAKWIVTSVCAPTAVVLLDTFKEASVDRVPAVDACLEPLLRQYPSSGREEFEWKQHATAAARFATPAILPSLREGWNSSALDSAVLAILMRNDPHGAVELLAREATAGRLDGLLFFETAKVYMQVKSLFPEEVLTWLRAKLSNGSNKEASIAAYAVSLGGDSTDQIKVEQRLERLRAQRQDKELTKDIQKTEIELASALSLQDSRVHVDEAERLRLGKGCMSDQCRLYLH